MKLRDLKAALARLPKNLDDNEVYVDGETARLTRIEQDLLGGDFVVAGKPVKRLNIIRLSGSN